MGLESRSELLKFEAVNKVRLGVRGERNLTHVKCKTATERHAVYY